MALHVPRIQLNIMHTGNVHSDLVDMQKICALLFVIVQSQNKGDQCYVDHT